MLTSRSGARIQVRKDAECDPNSEDRPITLIGKKEHVDEARRLVTETVTRAQSGEPAPGSQFGGGAQMLPSHIEEIVPIIRHNTTREATNKGPKHTKERRTGSTHSGTTPPYASQPRSALFVVK